MNREKVLELAREAEILRQLSMEVPFVVDRLERFAAIIEREVRGDAEPVASVHIKDGCLVGSHRKSGADFPDGQYGLYPIGTHPAVIRQLVEALRMVLDDPNALDGRPRTYECVQEALAAAKGADV